MIPMLLMALPHAVKNREPEERREEKKERARVKIKRKNKVCGSMLILQPRHRRCSV